MSGAGDASGSATGAGLSGLLDRFRQSGQASQFSADGSAPSQFTMPGGGIPQYQGTQMLPATLGGVQGVADAQDWTKAVQNAGSGIDWQAMAKAAGGTGGQLQAGQDQQTPHAMAGAHAGGQQAAYMPQQLQGMPTMPTQGAVNLQNPVNATLGPTQSVQNLMQLLKLGNAGFNIGR
jgi:hypothetical protein